MCHLYIEPGNTVVGGVVSITYGAFSGAPNFDDFRVYIRIRRGSVKAKHDDFFTNVERYAVRVGALIIFLVFVAVEVVYAVRHLLR